MARAKHSWIWSFAGLWLVSLSGCHAHRAPQVGELILELPRTQRSAPGTVLYLESPLSRSVSDTGRLIEISSAGPSFRAQPSAVQSGDRVRFVNQGAVAHRIFITDQAGRRERMVSPGAHSAELAITRSGEHRFYCSLHPDESILLFAAPSSHFVVPSGEARYTLENLPRGVYQVSWWSEVGVRRLGSVEIQSGRTAARAVPEASGPSTVGPGSHVPAR